MKQNVEVKAKCVIIVKVNKISQKLTEVAQL